MNDEAKPSGDDAKVPGAELVEGVLWDVLTETGSTWGEKMRAALALAELQGDASGLSKAKRKALRKIINAEADPIS